MGRPIDEGSWMPFLEERQSYEGKGEPLGTARQGSKISGNIAQEAAAEALERDDESGLGCAVSSS